MGVRQCFWGRRADCGGACSDAPGDTYGGDTNEGTNENANDRENENANDGGSAVSYHGGYGSVFAYRVQRAGKDSV